MLTRSGFGAALTAVALAVAGWWWRYEELVVIALGVAAALVVAVWAARMPTQLTITRFVPAPRVARGDPITVEYRVANRRRRRSVPAMIIDHAQPATVDSPTAPLSSAAVAPVEIRLPVPAIDHLDRTDVVGGIPTSRRGVFTVGPWAIERVDPFGLAVGRVASSTTSAIIVHPRVHALGGPYGDTHSVQDEALVRRSASDPLSGFVSLREYVDGDDPRLIHWPTSARMGTLMLREHVELRRPEFTVVLDTADAPVARSLSEHADALRRFEADFEEMVDVTASIAVHALRSGVEVRVRTTSRDFPGAPTPLEADTQVLDLLTPVVPTPPERTASLAATLHGQAVLQHQGAMVVVVTGPSGPSQALGAIVAARIVRVGAGARLAPGVSLAVEDALEFARRWVAWE